MRYCEGIMNTEKNQIEIEENQPVDKSRRRAIGAGIAAPVIMTLASKPVFAFQGLSNMLSGNTSHAVKNDRFGGMSPGFWKALPGSTPAPFNDTGSAAWDLTGYKYGNLKWGGSRNKWSDYTGGTLYSSVFGSGYAGESLREVLNKYESDTIDGIKPFHFIAGLLNARYFDAKAGAGTTKYIFTEAQFWILYQMDRARLADLCSSNYYDKY
jgi:hypothetical protein